MSFLFPFGFLRRFFNVRAEEYSPEVDKTTSKGKVVVGGGTGFVGTELCRLLRRNHYEIVVVSRYNFRTCFNHPLLSIVTFIVAHLTSFHRHQGQRRNQHIRETNGCLGTSCQSLDCPTEQRLSSMLPDRTFSILSVRGHQSFNSR